MEIAREGNMTRAAKRLHVTQPTLSKQMKELEQENEVEYLNSALLDEAQEGIAFKDKDWVALPM